MKKTLENNIRKKCAVCKNFYMTSDLDLNPCPFCGWYNDSMCEENPDKVIYRNLISFNKAKHLYTNREPLKPNLNDFLEAFDFYGETGFRYNNIEFGLYSHGENGIEMSWGPEPSGTIHFKNKEDFIENAKIGDEYIKDIWDEIEEPSYL